MRSGVIISSLIALLVVVCGVAPLTVSEASAQEVYSYSVTGVVKALPGNGRAANEIIVKHDPIPNYRDEAGNVVGMAAMTMPFYLSAQASIEGIQVGDSIELTVEQRLKPKFSESVVALHKRPTEKK
jgi:Cu/Ag efflux protein CusF